MALSIAEVLEEVQKQDKKIKEKFKKNESWSLKTLLQQNFHPEHWLIPPGSTYNENQTSCDTSFILKRRNWNIIPMQEKIFQC